MATIKNIIKRTSWEDDSKSWSLEGMAQATFDWLSNVVNGSTQHPGWELVGTLDPANSSPTAIPEPPPWRTPNMMMRAMCAWFSSSAQDYLFSTGTVPLVRAQFDLEGALVTRAGADVKLSCWRHQDAMSNFYYYLIVDQQSSAFPLTSTATIAVTATAMQTPPILAHVVASDSAIGPPITAAHLPTGFDIQQYAGFQILFGVAPHAQGAAYVHIHA